ncbi:MAG: VIT1/CCC1 transporter family protein [Candidatus Bathycorpusculaceae bacterium]
MICWLSLLAPLQDLLALKNTRVVAIAGLITGVAASLSMATSEYLSTKSEEDAYMLLRLNNP